MTPAELDAQVAQATGESLAEIRRRGFSLADGFEIAVDPEPFDVPPQLVDWDELDRQRIGLLP